jgi:MFS transporter, DHA1 family, tetracycline resistance protein
VVPLPERKGERIVSQIGLALLFLAYALIYFVQTLNWFFPVLVLWAAGAAMVEPSVTTMLSKRAPEKERGAVMGTSDALNSAALIFAPAVGTAIVGADARLIGILPGVAVAGAWLLGHLRGRNIEAEDTTPNPTDG